MSEAEERDLAESLDHYIDPAHPEFDPDFALEIISVRPDWFTADEIAKVRALLN